VKQFLFIPIIIIALAFGESKAAAYKVETIASGLETPWSLAFLPNGDMLVTELEGRLRLIKRGGSKLVKQPIKGVPQVLYAGQGGLMDVVIDPQFRRNRFIYLSYAGVVDGKNATHVMRAKLQGRSLSNQKVIFRASPLKSPPVHYGGRMAFMKDGTLLITLGDGFDFREDAQNPKNHYGTIVRIHTDGSVPKDNPFVKNKKGAAEVWSFGHRNAQAIVVDSRGRVFANEHGPQGGDEVNLIEKGKNYGWPLITYGLDYSGATISPWTKKKGLEQPLYQWTPSIGPSAMAFYEGRLFPQWRGSFLTTSLVFGRVDKLTLKGNKVAGKPETLFEGLDARLRDIRVDKKGAIYLLAESKGEVLKITPK
jgi:glucose/arabinose dehydrogenase